MEWNGALRWFKSDESGRCPRGSPAAQGSRDTLRAADKSEGCFAPLEPVAARLHRGLKAAFDPHGVFNPGRMYAEI